MQVDSLCGSNSVMLSTLYYTALTHIDGASDLDFERVGFGAEVAQAIESYHRDTTLTIRGAPGPLSLYL